MTSVLLPGDDPVERWQKDWPLWMKDVLGVALTPDQRQLCESVMKHSRTLGQSAHGVGKTFAAAAIAVTFLCVYSSSQVVVTSSSLFQVRERLMAEIIKLWRRARIDLGGEVTSTAIKLAVDWKLLAVSVADPANLQGAHPKHLLLIADEAQAVEAPILTAFEGMMSGAHTRTLLLFNPLTASGPMYDRVRRTDEWHTVKLSALRHPNVVSGKNIVDGAITRQWVEERKHQWGENSSLFLAMVLGEFPTETDDTLVTMADLVACADLRKPLPGDGMWVGCDPARFGSDQTWIVLMDDGRVIVERHFSGLDTMATCGQIRRLCDEFDVPWDHVNIDSTGVGGGVVDRLRESDCYVNDVLFGARPEESWENGPFGEHLGIAGTRFANLKAELHWTLRTLLQRRMLSIPARFARIWSDCLAPRYDFDSEGRIRIEGKDHLKARLGRSPDAGDALVVALARPRAPTISFI